MIPNIALGQEFNLHQGGRSGIRTAQTPTKRATCHPPRACSYDAAPHSTRRQRNQTGFKQTDDDRPESKPRNSGGEPLISPGHPLRRRRRRRRRFPVRVTVAFTTPLAPSTVHLPVQRLLRGGGGYGGAVTSGAHGCRANAWATAAAPPPISHRPFSSTPSAPAAAAAAVAATPRVAAAGLDAAAADHDNQAEEAGEPRERAQEHPVLDLDHLGLLIIFSERGERREKPAG